jgi:hypothetical protein
MHTTTSLLRTLMPVLVVLAVFLAGCTAPAPLLETGSIQVTSTPSGAGVYLDNEYKGTTPVTLRAVTAGTHTVEVRLDGYERWTTPVSFTKGSAGTLSAIFVSLPVTLPVTFAPTTGPTVRPDLPQIHVDGYWTYPQGRDSTANPVALLVHTDAFNVGNTGAREVTVAANFWYQGRMVCWNTVYLGTLAPGGHVFRDSLVSCTLPSGFTSQDLTVRFENLVVTP